MKRRTLTAVGVARVRPPDDARRRRMDWDAVVPGLALRTTAHGAKSWVLVTRYGGKVVFVTLGKSPGLELATARDLAREGLARVACGEDPRVRKHAVAPKPEPDTVEAVAARFIVEWCKPRNRQWREQERLVNWCVLPAWKGRRFAEITRADVVALTDAIAKKTPIQANRTLSLLKRMLRWGLKYDLIAAHPAVGLEPPAPERARTRVLDDGELRELWKAFLVMRFPWGTVLQMALLTATRRGEVQDMKWSEIDAGERVWTIPAARVKTKQPFLVPLSAMAVELLAGVPRIDGFVFTTRDSKAIRDWSGAVERATTLSGVNGWRPHDLRRTVRTNLSKLGIPADIGERVLGHVVGGVRGIYDQHDYLPQRRDALERWAARLAEVVGDGG